MNLPADVALSTGRVVTHTRNAMGHIDAVPTTGNYWLTPAEDAEYCAARGFKSVPRR